MVGLAHLRTPLQRRGQEVDDVVQQHLGPQAGEGGAADHREQGEVLHAGVEALDHLGIGKLLAIEEPLHELLAGLRHGLHQGVVQLVENVLLVVGHGDLVPLAVFNVIGPLVKHVDDADDLLALVPDGGHHGGDILAEAVPQGVKGGVIVGVVLVGLGDVEDAGHLALLTVLPGLLRPHAHAALGRADDHGGVGHPQGLHDLAGEVEIARRIQHIDLAALILHRHHGGGDGKLALDLLWIEVADGISVGHLAHAVDHAGLKQHALGQGRLSVSTVAQQTDIADVLRGITHSRFLSLLLESSRKRRSYLCVTVLVIISQSLYLDNSFFIKNVNPLWSLFLPPHLTSARIFSIIKSGPPRRGRKGCFL